MFRRGYVVVAGMATVLALTMAMTVPAAGKVVRSDHKKGPAHIFYIMMENHGYDEIIGNTADAPYINELASTYGVAPPTTSASTHPSLPNYLAAVLGRLPGHLGRLQGGRGRDLRPRGVRSRLGRRHGAADWLDTAEVASATATAHSVRGPEPRRPARDARASPGRRTCSPCRRSARRSSTRPSIGDGNGPASSTRRSTTRSCTSPTSGTARAAALNNIVPFDGNFAAGPGARATFRTSSGSAPTSATTCTGCRPSGAALIGMPDLRLPRRRASTTAPSSSATQFLKDTVSQIMHSPAWRTSNSSIVIVWDEDDYSAITGCCSSPTGVDGVVLGGAQVPAIVLNSRGDDSSRVNSAANHYTMLAAIERLWNLGCINESCSVSGRRLARLFH